ncbi:hypothetical protein Tco_1164816 [Tanacetum coccineum]
MEANRLLSAGLTSKAALQELVDAKEGRQNSSRYFMAISYEIKRTSNGADDDQEPPPPFPPPRWNNLGSKEEGQEKNRNYHALREKTTKKRQEDTTKEVHPLPVTGFFTTKRLPSPDLHGNNLVPADHQSSNPWLRAIREEIDATEHATQHPRGFICKNKDKKNRLMCIDELHKFSDSTLDDVRTALNDRLKGIRMDYYLRLFGANMTKQIQEL